MFQHASTSHFPLHFFTACQKLSSSDEKSLMVFRYSSFVVFYIFWVDWSLLLSVCHEAPLVDMLIYFSEVLCFDYNVVVSCSSWLLLLLFILTNRFIYYPRFYFLFLWKCTVYVAYQWKSGAFQWGAEKTPYWLFSYNVFFTVGQKIWHQPTYARHLLRENEQQI